MNLDAEELAPLPQLRRVTLAAREPVDVLGHDDVEAPLLGIGKHAQEFRPMHGRGRYLVILVDRSQAPAVAIDQGAAERNLIINRAFVLAVAGKARVDDGA